MRHRIPALLAGLTIAWSAPLGAQVPDWVSQLLTAARLPVTTAAARQEGIAGTDIRSILDAMRRARVPAAEATVLFDTARVVHRDNGPVNNFGAFVQSQLAAGKRGTELAAAIRAEHGRAGKGKGAGNAPNVAPGRDDRGEGKGRDAADTARPGRGRPQPPGAPKPQDNKQGDRGRGRPPNH